MVEEFQGKILRKLLNFFLDNFNILCFKEEKRLYIEHIVVNCGYLVGVLLYL